MLLSECLLLRHSATIDILQLHQNHLKNTDIIEKEQRPVKKLEIVDKLNKTEVVYNHHIFRILEKKEIFIMSGIKRKRMNRI